MQLSLDSTSKPQREQTSIIQNEVWLDVSEIARGVGFTIAIQVSITLNDALEALQNVIDGDYDQRLYDALWTAPLNLSLHQSPSTTFNFTFRCADWETKKASDVNLRLRVETQKQVVILGLLEGF